MFIIETLSWWQVGIMSLIGLIAVVFIIEGPERLFNRLFKRTEGKQSRVGWIAFVSVFLILMLLAGLASGEENKDFKLFSLHNTEPFFGIGDTFKPSPQCEEYMADRENNFSQTLTSSGGIRQHLTDNPVFNLFGQYLHNSCVNNQDEHTLDSIALMLSVSLVGDYLQLHVGKAWLPDEKHWYTNYVLKWNIVSVSKGRGVFGIKYDQKDFSSHETEEGWNSGMIAAEFSFRMK